jgi:hypothetical protein
MGAVTPGEIHAQRRGEPGSQATRIEQSRAVAEVQAAYTMAAARPRDPTRALNQILESCKMKSVAESAFFKFPRGGKSVTGETIHLAVEMARCWGNISYSIAELERDDGRGISEMLSTATDLETNTTSRTSFIVPHKRDKEGNQPASPLTSMRDIYENNANMGARRLRECIFRVLPTWLVDAARTACYETLANSDDERPLPVRIAEAVTAFANIGISQERIEAKVGPVSALTAVDLAALQISFRSVKRGEIGAEDEFPRVGVEEATRSARQIAGKASKPKQDAPKSDQRQDTVTAENPSAAEGPGDDDRGEAHNDAGPQPQTILETLDHNDGLRDRLITEVKSKELLADLVRWERETQAQYDSLPENAQALVDEAIAARRAKLQGGR